MDSRSRPGVRRWSFAAGLAWRLGFLLLTAFLFVASLQMPELAVARFVAGVLCVASATVLWRYLQRTNIEVARFVDAVRFGDLAQSFSHGVRGSGFDELGRALDEGMQRLREERERLIDTNRFYEAVLDDAPVALLTVDSDGRVELANKAARRLFTTHSGVRIEDFTVYGTAFGDRLRESSQTGPRLVPMIIDSVPQSAIVTTAVVHRLGGLVQVVAVQPIQSELNAVEVAAQSDLIRVLTHEIMNSMTPVTSLAHTAADLIAGADRGGDPAIADARAAIETLARRADGVMHFVESYRQLSRRPQVRMRSFSIGEWAHELESLFVASEAAEGVTFALSVGAPDLAIEADPDLLFQVVLNLLRNAAEAARGHSDSPEVTLGFGRTESGRIRIDVADNGPGVPPELAQDVFLPFFTTKPKGSGVGLSLARQLVLAHRGSITLDRSPAGGALFRIII